MDTALPGMLHCFTANGSSTDMVVLQRHMASRKWQEEQLTESDRNQNSYGGFSLNEFRSLFSSPIQVSKVQSFQGLMGGNESALGEVVVVGSLKPDRGFDVVWPELEMPSMESGSSGLVKGTTELEAKYSVSRASSSTPAMAVPAPGEAKLQESTEKINSAAAGGDSFKRRRAEKMQNTMVIDSKEKKIKVSIQETESKMTDQNSTKTDNQRETSADTAKENNSKASDFQKPDYIHVRAHRGQATDSHSLAERVRREKISERMRYLQDLVPGCNKITGKAGMLDEIINYVQSLQCQVEFLSMKLAALNPRLGPIVDGIFAKEAFPSCSSNFPNVGISSEANNSAYTHQFNPLQQMLSSSDLEMERSPSDIGLRRTISTPVSFIPETFVSSSCFTQNQPPSAFEADLQNFYNVPFDIGRSTDFSSHSYTGSIEASSLKMEIGSIEASSLKMEIGFRNNL